MKTGAKGTTFDFLITSLCVAAGGGLGALCRTLLGAVFVEVFHVASFVSTMVINTVGCFAIGYLFLRLEAMYCKNSKYGHFADDLNNPKKDLTIPAIDYFANNQRIKLLSALLITGFLGGFTTFSSYALYTIRLYLDRALISALINIVLTILLCFLAVLAGMFVAKKRLD